MGEINWLNFFHNFWTSLGAQYPHEREPLLRTLAREAGAAAGKTYAEARAAKPATHPTLTHPLVGRRVEIVSSGWLGVVESVDADGSLTVVFDGGAAGLFGRTDVRLLEKAQEGDRADD